MPIPKKLSHIDSKGAATMVDVGHKAVQFRRATAAGKLFCAPATIRLLKKQPYPRAMSWA